MFGPNASQGYDRSSIMYAPDGRIIQTEYAREAMRRGSIALAIRSNQGVVLAGKLKVVDLDFPNSKISKIDEHISVIFSGYAADGRVIIDKARVEAAIHKLTYDETIDLRNLATTLADYTHRFTVQGGLTVPVTTTAHGSAFAIAGKNEANLDPILNSFKIALSMAENKKN